MDNEEEYFDAGDILVETMVRCKRRIRASRAVTNRCRVCRKCTLLGHRKHPWYIRSMIHGSDENMSAPIQCPFRVTEQKHADKQKQMEEKDQHTPPFPYDTFPLSTPWLKSAEMERL